MRTANPTWSRSACHPLHAALLAGSVPLFLGALLSDWAYSASYHIQWQNFSSWLIVGALVLTGAALLWALIDVIGARGRSAATLVLFGLLLATWVLGFVDALVHAKDAWASMPAGLILSIVATVLALVSAWLGFAGIRSGDVK